MLVLDSRFIQHLLQLDPSEYANYLFALAPEDRLAIQEAVARRAHRAIPPGQPLRDGIARGEPDSHHPVARFVGAAANR